MPYAKLVLEREQNEIPEGFPPILQTPSGLALIELQGRINVGSNSLILSALDLERETDGDANASSGHFDSTTIRQLGKLDFTDNKGVILNVGNRQRLKGKIVDLKPPLAILQMHQADMTRTQLSQAHEMEAVEIPVLEVVHHKIIFNSRPEPMIGAN